MTVRVALQIFKAQRPVACTPGAERTVYIHNQDKSIVFNGPVSTKMLCKLFPKDEYKVFWYGASNNRGILKLKLNKKAPWQEW